MDADVTGTGLTIAAWDVIGVTWRSGIAASAPFAPTLPLPHRRLE